MTSLEDLHKEIDQIKIRNERVEADKAWETSWARKIIILILTYLVIVLFFYTVQLPHPLVNAVVPSIAFVLSTLTVPLIKQWWIKKIHKK